MAINTSLPIVPAIMAFATFAGLGAAGMMPAAAAENGLRKLSFVVGAWNDSPADARVLRQRAPVRPMAPIVPRLRPLGADEVEDSTNYQPLPDPFPEQRVLVLARQWHDDAISLPRLAGSANQLGHAVPGCDELTRHVLDSNDDGYRESVRIECD